MQLASRGQRKRNDAKCAIIDEITLLKICFQPNISIVPRLRNPGFSWPPRRTVGETKTTHQNCPKLGENDWAFLAPPPPVSDYG